MCGGCFSVLLDLTSKPDDGTYLRFVFPCPSWQNMEKDKALERRFQQVFVKQPNVEDTVSETEVGRHLDIPLFRVHTE